MHQYSLNQLEKCLAFSVNHRMDPDAREAFMALANCHREDGSGPITGIVRTNGLSIEGLRPGMNDEVNLYSATCKDISRLNHRQVPLFDPMCQD
jgi:hypothetical protein